MERDKEILREWAETTLLSGQDIRLPYDVPADYFKTLPSILIKDIADDKIGSAEKLGFADYSVPDGYFEGLSNTVLASVGNIEERDGLDSIAPIFKTISREVPYQVPAGYLENLQANALKSESKPTTTKVIPVSHAGYWTRIVVAAATVGVIVLCATLFSGRDTKTPTTYLSYKSVDLKGNLDKLSDDELEKYLNNDNLTSNADLIILDDGALPNVAEQKIQTVSDEDLKQYLQETGTSKNVKKGI